MYKPDCVLSERLLVPSLYSCYYLRLGKYFVFISLAWWGFRVHLDELKVLWSQSTRVFFSDKTLSTAFQVRFSVVNHCWQHILVWTGKLYVFHQGSFSPSQFLFTSQSLDTTFQLLLIFTQGLQEGCRRLLSRVSQYLKKWAGGTANELLKNFREKNLFIWLSKDLIFWYYFFFFQKGHGKKLP